MQIAHSVQMTEASIAAAAMMLMNLSLFLWQSDKYKKIEICMVDDSYSQSNTENVDTLWNKRFVNDDFFSSHSLLH